MYAILFYESCVSQMLKAKENGAENKMREGKSVWWNNPDSSQVESRHPEQPRRAHQQRFRAHPDFHDAAQFLQPNLRLLFPLHRRVRLGGAVGREAMGDGDGFFDLALGTDGAHGEPGLGLRLHRRAS